MKRQKRQDPERSLVAAVGEQVVTVLVYAVVTGVAVLVVVYVGSALVSLVGG
jgi:hypothetical protein